MRPTHETPEGRNLGVMEGPLGGRVDGFLTGRLTSWWRGWEIFGEGVRIGSKTGVGVIDEKKRDP